MNRWRDWIEQGKLNLRAAKNSLKAGDFAWACFAAHQAGEAALKGLHLRLGQIAWGHSLMDLLSALPEDIKVSPELMGKAGILDRLYIPTRYPDAHPSGPASIHYRAEDAEEALAIAEEIVRFCESESLADR
ncbi:HEPN domain-containing protein [bacterium]|nr:HEPN domain-containing protein [bacterium]